MKRFQFSPQIAHCLGLMGSFTLFETALTAKQHFWLQTVFSMKLTEIIDLLSPSLLFRLFSLHLSLFLFLYAVVTIFRLSVKRSLGFVVLVGVYIFSYYAVFYPSFLEVSSKLRPIVRWLSEYRSEGFVFLVGFLISIALFQRSWKIWKDDRSLQGFLSRIAFSSVATLFIFYGNNPLIHAYESQVSPSPQTTNQPHIIFVGVDGLRPDTLNRVVATGRFPIISKFLKNSHYFENAISPIARTHPSFHSIFQAKPASELQIRTNHSYVALDTDQSLRHSKLEQLRQNGYHVHISLSDSAHSSYAAGQVVNSVSQPPAGLYNIALPQLFRSPVILSLFNNSLGQWILPEIIGNSGFSEIFRQDLYLQSVQRDLKISMASGKPVFGLFHNVSLHWPGAAEHPFPRCSEGSHVAKSCFQYGRHSHLTDPIAFSFEKDRKRNLEIYESNVEHLFSEYLEPLFTSFEKSGIFDHAIVVLLSDHGEAFFQPRLLPYGKTPNHGSLLGFGDDSYHSVLAIYKKGLTPSRISDPFPLYDIFPYIENQISREHSVFTARTPLVETDRWVSPLIPGSGNYLPLESGFAVYSVAPNQRVFLNPRYERILKWQKARGVVDATGLRFILPTEFGTIGEQTSNFESLFAKDFQEGFVLNPKDYAKIGHRFEQEPSKFDLLFLQSGVESLYRDLRPKYALDVFRKIVRTPSSEDVTKELAALQILKICALFPKEKIGQDAYADSISAVSRPRDLTFDFEHLKNLFLCSRAHGDNQTAETALRKLAKTSAAPLHRSILSLPRVHRLQNPLIFIESIDEPSLVMAKRLVRQLGIQTSLDTSSEFDQAFASLQVLVNAESNSPEFVQEFEHLIRLSRSEPGNEMYGVLHPWYLALIMASKRSDKDLINLAKMIVRADSRLSLYSVQVLSALLSQGEKERELLLSKFWDEEPGGRGDFAKSRRADFRDLVLNLDL